MKIIPVLISVLLVSPAASVETTTRSDRFLPQDVTDSLLRLFEETSHYDMLEQDIRNHYDDSNFQRIDVKNVLEEFRNTLEDYLEKKIVALRHLVAVAEEANRVQNLGTNNQTLYALWKEQEEPTSPPEFVNVHCVDCDSSCNCTGINETHQHEPGWSDVTMTSVHIPLEVYDQDEMVVRDVSWTGDPAVLNAFRANKNETGDSSIFRQYISTEEGVTRMHPARAWRMDEPRAIVVDLFDPRFRPWYTGALTAPKDVLLVLDYSGSTEGQTSRLMNFTVLTILSSLTANDYINAMWYNAEAGSLLWYNDAQASARAHHFIPATSRNKRLLLKKLGAPKIKGHANFSKAMEFAFSIFKKHSNRTEQLSDKNFGSGGHQLMILVSDGTEDWAEDIVNRNFPANEDGTRNTTIRVFAISIGQETTKIAALEWIACVSNGAHIAINTLHQIKKEARKFVPLLSKSLALTYKGNDKSEQRRITWSGPYMDAQGEGPMLTMSMPILNTTDNATDQRFIGVAAIDVKISVINFMAPHHLLGNAAYFFAVDNNGHIIFHPRYKYPMSDLQLFRKSHCFNITVTKSSDHVLFGKQATEAIYRQMGYLDSIEILDLLEMEQPLQAVKQLRNTMVLAACAEKTEFTVDQSEIKDFLMDVPYRYSCENFDDKHHIPYSIGLAAYRSGSAPRMDVPSMKKHLLLELNSTYNQSWIARIFLAPRTVCNDWDLGKIDLPDRFRFLIRDLACSGDCPTCAGYPSDKQLQLMLRDVAATKNWGESWGIMDPLQNETCHDLVNNIDKNLRMAFVQTDGGVSVVYTMCDLHKDVGDLGRDSAVSEFFADGRDAGDNLEFTTTSEEKNSVYISRAVHKYDYTLAVVGIKVLKTWLWNETKNNGNLPYNCTEQNITTNSNACYLVTDQGEVIYSSAWDLAPNLMATQDTLERLDGDLFKKLKDENNLKNYTTVDYQAFCKSGRKSWFVGRAGRISLDIFKFFSSILSFLWNELVLLCGVLLGNLELGDAFAIRDFRPLGCKVEDPGPAVESCVKRITHFRLSSKSSKHDAVTGKIDGALPREYKLWKLPDTNLFIITVSHLPDDSSRRRSVFSLASEAREVVLRYEDLVDIRYRRRLQEYPLSHPEEVNDSCGGSRVVMRFLVLFLPVLVSKSLWSL